MLDISVLSSVLYCVVNKYLTMSDISIVVECPVSRTPKQTPHFDTRSEINPSRTRVKNEIMKTAQNIGNHLCFQGIYTIGCLSSFRGLILVIPGVWLGGTSLTWPPRIQTPSPGTEQPSSSREINMSNTTIWRWWYVKSSPFV